MTQLPDPLVQLHDDLSVLLNRAAALFVPGAKLTLVVRHPSHPDGSRDVVIGNDTSDAAIAAIRVREADTAARILT